MPKAKPGVSNLMPHLKHIGALDGLRAIAIIGVLVAHLVPPLFSGGTYLRDWAKWLVAQGGLGVDLFFALSGFLITGILIDSKPMPVKLYFARFYQRRSLRIFPAYYAFLFPLLFVPRFFQHLSRWSFALYTRNWLGPDRYSDDILGHLWSLAVEEQFYLLWAPVVFFCSKRALPWLMIALSIFVIPERLLLVVRDVSAYDIIRFTTARLDGFLLGGLVAITWRQDNWVRVKVWSRVVAPIALLCFFLNLKLGDRLQWVLFSSWSAVFFASVIALCLGLPQASWLNRILSGRALRKIAQYSYAIYLWHLLVGRVFFRATSFLIAHFGWNFGPVPKAVYLILLFTTVYAVAALSWYLIEQPMLRFKR